MSALLTHFLSRMQPNRPTPISNLPGFGPRKVPGSPNPIPNMPDYKPPAGTLLTSGLNAIAPRKTLLGG